MGKAKPVLQAASVGGVERALQLHGAVIQSVEADGGYLVQVQDGAVRATIGTVLPQLVAGDRVLLAQTDAEGLAVITALLVPAPHLPWSQRAIRIESGQSVTLAAGATSLRLTAEGLVRLVALSIEQDARDRVNIDAAEVRIN